MSIPTITLSENEQRLARLLVECADWVDANPDEVDKLRLKDDDGKWIGKEWGNEKIELRIAGGWVRDKLLGQQSDDIDVSTSPDPITGLKFAMLFERYLESLGQRDLMGKLTKIEAKPEQSKHLETATARVCDLSVDWVQQRGQEVYTEGSRIPTVAFGTPLEDAERRDLTINALFYNLRTVSIEDQTGKGLSDLGLIPNQPRRIRTPLEPFKTFRDDPLRVVRAVRFAARFGREFELDEEMVSAIERDEIRHALLDPKKISRERVGTELDKMLLGRDPQYAFELMERLRLHPLVFLYDHSTSFLSSSPSSPAPPPPDTSLAVTAATLLSSLLSRPIYPHTLKRLYLSCGLLPLYDLSCNDKKKVIWVGERVVRDGIKGPTVDGVWVKKARDAAEVLGAAVSRLAGEESMQAEEDRVEIDQRALTPKSGLLLRNPSVHDGQHVRWNISLFWSLIVDLVRVHGDAEASSKMVEAYNRFVERILALELDTRAFDAPLLDGKAINALLPSTKNSPAMVHVLQLVVRFQLAHPAATAQDCETYLMQEARVEIEALCSKNKKQGVKRKEPK
ncbi:SPOSA6832_00742 [Sporobolomyces salmonicolor]|uniref:SPOSA6832_00742-mRNA-1:cds n=1 Tax=Sporidiobolus salmonicolor TaxID=5005 RepID=A0A0D6EH22_SPOSA|nr:SPOSA6832_00742 [Sporobolomyces salmonicolor]